MTTEKFPAGTPIWVRVGVHTTEHYAAISRGYSENRPGMVLTAIEETVPAELTPENLVLLRKEGQSFHRARKEAFFAGPGIRDTLQSLAKTAQVLVGLAEGVEPDPSPGYDDALEKLNQDFNRLYELEFGSSPTRVVVEGLSKELAAAKQALVHNSLVAATVAQQMNQLNERVRELKRDKDAEWHRASQAQAELATMKSEKAKIEKLEKELASSDQLLRAYAEKNNQLETDLGEQIELRWAAEKHLASFVEMIASVDDTKGLGFSEILDKMKRERAEVADKTAKADDAVAWAKSYQGKGAEWKRKAEMYDSAVAQLAAEKTKRQDALKRAIDRNRAQHAKAVEEIRKAAEMSAVDMEKLFGKQHHDIVKMHKLVVWLFTTDIYHQTTTAVLALLLKNHAGKPLVSHPPFTVAEEGLSQGQAFEAHRALLEFELLDDLDKLKDAGWSDALIQQIRKPQGV